MNNMNPEQNVKTDCDCDTPDVVNVTKDAVNTVKDTVTKASYTFSDKVNEVFDSIPQDVKDLVVSAGKAAGFAALNEVITHLGDDTKAHAVNPFVRQVLLTAAKEARNHLLGTTVQDEGPHGSPKE
jgi:hypothetical protein